MTLIGRWRVAWDRFLMRLTGEDEGCMYCPDAAPPRECVRRYRHGGPHVYPRNSG